MDNIQKPHKAIYLGLLIILFVLIIMVLYIPLPKFKKSSVSPTPNSGSIPTQTEIPIKKPVTSPKPTLVMPTGTGAMEDFPKNIADVANQKQSLKKKVPIKTKAFTLVFNYEIDKFIVTINDPADKNYPEFEKWLKNNYPLISIQSIQIEK